MFHVLCIFIFISNTFSIFLQLSDRRKAEAQHKAKQQSMNVTQSDCGTALFQGAGDSAKQDANREPKCTWLHHAADWLHRKLCWLHRAAVWLHDWLHSAAIWLHWWLH